MSFLTNSLVQPAQVSAQRPYDRRVGQLLKSIEVVLGRTHFDNAIHDGWSNTRDLEYPNGTIVQVAKNGFRSLRDGKVIVEPKVIVNRI